MPNLGKVLKDEIARLARKQLRADFGSTRKQVSGYRREIARLKRELQSTQKRLASLEKNGGARASAPAAAPQNGEPKRRGRKPQIGGPALKKHREKLGLSAADYAKLAGVSMLSIYHYEQGKATPRSTAAAKLLELRKLGKREAIDRLVQIDGKPRRKRAA